MISPGERGDEMRVGYFKCVWITGFGCAEIGRVLMASKRNLGSERGKTRE